MQKSLLCCLFLVLVAAFASADDVILKPITSGEEIGIIFIQGAQISPSAYTPLSQLIQQQLASAFSTPLAAWVGIPQFTLDAPNPVTISSTIDHIVQAMLDAGMNTRNIFFMGHSLGGAMVQDYVANHTIVHDTLVVGGQILMGSFLTRKYSVNTNTTRLNYPIPTLTLSGELDGLCRVTRIAESYYRQIQTSVDPENATMYFPVVVLEGVSHMQFASGNPPPLVKKSDLKPEVSDQDAHQAMAAIIADFIQVRLFNDASAAKELQQSVSNTATFVAPIISSLILEGFYHFLPPCYSNPPSPSCLYGNPWTESVAQIMMSGLTNISYTVKDAFHPVDQINPVHLPHIWNNCTYGQPDCVLNITTVSQNIYSTLDQFDTGFYYTSASEIRSKLVSRQSSYIAAGVPADFNITDTPSICATINQASLNWAMNRAAEKTLARYNSLGQPMYMGSDLGPFNAGPLWIWNSMHYTNTSSGLEVQAPMMRTPVDYPIKAAAGFHYCKLLSPARALEWIYIDSLRLNDHI